MRSDYDKLLQYEVPQEGKFQTAMNDKPPSTSGTGVIARIRRALKGSPWSREEIQEFIEQSETDLDAEEKSMLSGVLEVSETQVRTSWCRARTWS